MPNEKQGAFFGTAISLCVNCLAKAEYIPGARVRFEFGLSIRPGVVHALSRGDLERVKELIMELVHKTREIVRPYPEEETICFALDLFRI